MNGQAGLLLRVVSKFIDLTLIFAALEALPRAGWFAGIGYILIGDGLFQGRSIGKRLLGLRVLSDTGQSCSVKESIIRNSVFGAAMVIWKVPLIGILLAILIFAFEFIVLMGAKNGRRLGDELAKTYVIEEKKETE